MTSAEQSAGAHSIGWASSLFLHAVLAFGALDLTQRVGPAPPPAPFRWNVSMVASLPASLPSSSEPVTTVDSPAGSASSSAPLPNTLQRPYDSGRAAAVEPTLPASEAPIVPGTETSPFVTRSLSLVATEQPSATEEMNSPPEAVASIFPPSERETQPHSPTQEVISPEQTVEAAPRVSAVPRPDYAWLSEIIVRRMQELKRYPAEARLERAEGRVVLKAVIRSDGSIEDVELFQSSGHQSLDRAAVELLTLAAPFHFPRPLQKPQMTVKIPMNYRLE